jgi:peptide/nickel transport system substrate-binding protein
MRIKIFILLVLAVALSLLAAQCMVAPAPQGAVQTVVVKEQVEKQVVVTVEVPAAESADIVVALPEEPPNMDWGYVGLSHLPITRNVYEVLVNRDPVTGELIPELAESWEQIDDTTWRFKLRQGVTFSNGEPFNAEVAKWNLETLSDPELNKHVYGSIGHPLMVTVVDDYTIDVKSEEPDPITPRRMYWIHMGSPKAIQADPDLQGLMGTGAYMLEQWNKGESVVLVANPNYWGGEPQIKKVTFVFRTESAVRAAMVQADEADVAAWLAPQDAGPIRTLGANIPETPFIRMDPYAPLSDIRVRRAICMSIDRESLAKQIFAGYAKPATQLITPDVVGYNPDIPLWPYDPEAARALIEEARADGVPVDKELTIIGRKGIYANATEAMEALQGWLADIGLTAKLQMLETSAWVDASLANPQPPDRLGLIQSSHGNEAGDGIFTILGYYKSDATQNAFDDPKMDELIAKAVPLTGEARQNAIAEALAYQHDNVVQDCPMVHIQALWGLSGRIDWTPRFDNMILVKEVKLK